MSERWSVRVSAAADVDFDEIVRWTANNFGDAQATVYAETIEDAIHALRAGPDIIGVRVRDEIGRGYRTLHIARDGRRGRHLILFRVSGMIDRRLVIVRILHDSRDLSRHVPPDEE